MAEARLSVEKREQTGKGAARKLRAQGRVPGVFYGQGVASVSIQLDPRELDRLIAKSEAGMNTLIDLAGGDGLDGKVVLVKDLQRDPVTGRTLHADLYAVNLERAIQVSVPIHLKGRARGVELSGGIVDQALRELQVECLPRDIPKEIVLDVSELDIGHSLHVRDIALPPGVKLLSDPNLSVVSVVAPTVAEEPVAEEAAAPAEGEAAAPAEGTEPGAAESKEE